MEAQAVPREAAAERTGVLSPRMLRAATDPRLVALVRDGNGAAFEAMYDRYHRPIMSFCRHMLGDPDEAADAVQHTFLAAYDAIVSSQKTILLRAWLFTIARNRCYSVLRTRREHPAGELVEPSTEGLAAQVQRREDLRQLLGDLRRLPDDQRAALVLAELGMLSHGEIGAALGVPAAKVKALVFQARESLIASRTARDTDCTEIRRQLSTLRGGALRRGILRRHLRECQGCREYRTQVELQRRGLAAILPVAPSLALKDAVLGGLSSTGSAVGVVAGGGVLASTAIKGLALKGVLCALFALAGTAGTFAVVHPWRSGHGAVLSRARSAIAPGAVAEAAGPSVKLAGGATRHQAPRLDIRPRHAVLGRRAVKAAPLRAAHPPAAVPAAAATPAILVPHRAVRRARLPDRHGAPTVHHGRHGTPPATHTSSSPATSGAASRRPSSHGDGDSEGQNGPGKGGHGHHHGGGDHGS